MSSSLHVTLLVGALRALPELTICGWPATRDPGSLQFCSRLTSLCKRRVMVGSGKLPPPPPRKMSAVCGHCTVEALKGLRVGPISIDPEFPGSSRSPDRVRVSVQAPQAPARRSCRERPGHRRRKLGAVGFCLQLQLPTPQMCMSALKADLEESGGPWHGPMGGQGSPLRRDTWRP